MTERNVTVCYVLTERLKSLVKQWATEDDRSNSAVLRRLIEQEAQRRNTPNSPLEPETEVPKARHK